MASVVITDRMLQVMKPAPEGKPYKNIWDGQQAGLCVRVTPTGKKTFYVVRRRPGAKQPSWVSIGRYPAVGLKEARAKAKDVLGAIGEGREPKAAVPQPNKTTFADVAR